MKVNTNQTSKLAQIITLAKKTDDDLKKIPLGKKLMQAAEKMNKSEEMDNLLSFLEDFRISDENKETLASTLNDILNEDIEEGLKMYALYLQLLSEDPAYVNLKEYLLGLAEASEKLNSSASFKKYAKQVLAFENDNSKSIKIAKGKIAKFGKKATSA